jgi:hypothetical protein
VTRATFPLPALQARLAEASLDVHQGRGFAIVRGLDPRKYADEDNVTIFLAIASHIGEQRGLQDKKGSMLSTDRDLSPCCSKPGYSQHFSAHVTDSKVWTTPPEMRHGIHTTTGLVSSLSERSVSSDLLLMTENDGL